MQQEPGDVAAPSGTAIHAGADLIMSLISEEREATRSTEARLADLGLYLEQYKRWSQKNQANEALKLAASHKRILELEQKYLHLQTLKDADERTIHDMSGHIESLKQERDYLHTELSSSLNSQRITSAASVDLISDLTKYGIFFWGTNSLSFGDEWLQLWNQYVSEDPEAQDAGLSSNDRITPKELAILLENFSGQVRRERDVIQSQQQAITSLQKERAYLFELGNNHSKSLPYPTPIATDLQIPDSEIEHSKPFSFSDNQDCYSGTQPSAIKSEPSIEFPSEPALLFAPTDKLSGGPS